MNSIFGRIALLGCCLSVGAQAAGRSVNFTHFENINTVIYVTVSNVSTKAQTVNVTFKSSGSFILKTNSHAGGSAMKYEPSKTSCDLKNDSAFRILPPGDSLVLSLTVDGSGSYSATNPNSGMFGQIDVTQDDGYLIASGFASAAGSRDFSFTVNGGRPFHKPIDLSKPVNRIAAGFPMLFYFVKTLQATAMTVTALALFVGLRQDSMSKELTLLGAGVVLFLLRRAGGTRSGTGLITRPRKVPS